MYVCMYVYTYIHISIYIYTYTHVVHVYVYTYINTYIHACIPCGMWWSLKGAAKGQISGDPGHEVPVLRKPTCREGSHAMGSLVEA